MDGQEGGTEGVDSGARNGAGGPGSTVTFGHLSPFN